MGDCCSYIRCTGAGAEDGFPGTGGPKTTDWRLMKT